MANTKKQLLFVDDEPYILEMLDRLLTQCGEAWTGTFCLGVDEALEALRHTQFDTVVSDIRMPAKDGFVLIEAMRADNGLKNIPIIVLTGEGDRTLKRRVLDLGATDLLNKPVSREDLIARLRNALRLKEYEDQLANQVAVLDGLVRERTRQLEQSHREVVWRLAKAGEFRDDQTGNHVARVAWCSCVIAQEMGMSPDFVELLYQTSPLHDIGKIGIPDAILLKPGRLTPEEREVIERHALIGVDILRRPPKTAALAACLNTVGGWPISDSAPSPLLEMATTIAQSHHEKWDGSGYPDRLAGEDIPIEARIVALADVYDALTSERPYKKAMPETEATELILSERGRHFDPAVVNAFIAGHGRILTARENEESASLQPSAWAVDS